MFHLDDLETTVTRTRRPLIAAAALVSAVIALLGSELAMPLIEHLSAYGLAIVTMIEATVAALLGGFVVHHGLRRERNAGHVVGFAAMAGFVYPIILVMIPLICLAPFSDDTQMLAFSLFVCFIVSAFSAAIGCLFGVVFCVGTVIGARALATPSHQSPAIAWLASARMLLVGATLVVLALGRVCKFGLPKTCELWPTLIYDGNAPPRTER